MSGDQDQEHLKLLAIFHYVAAGLGALFSCFPILHVILGIAMLSGAMDGPNAPPRAFAWLFILFPGLFILVGWATAVCVAYVGRCLERRSIAFSAWWWRESLARSPPWARPSVCSRSSC